MLVRCPSCGVGLELSQEVSLNDVSCDECGSTFGVVQSMEDTVGFVPGASPQSAETTIGHFHLRNKLGAGSFGVVWKAHDTKLDRTVAIKIPRIGADAESPFLREAQAAAQLQHPSIVSVHEVGRFNDNIYIVSDFIEGAPLNERLKSGPMTLTEAITLCAQLADALEHAHQSGVVHRDLKPSNIMMAGDKPFIMDFGLAKRDVTEVTITVEGQILGTPAYMSPEQARGETQSVDGRSDIYSLGVILFELLTRELPFRGNLRGLLEQVIHDDPPSPRKLNASVPRDLETICLKCLRKPVDSRYPTAEELAADLRRWLKKEPIKARPSSLPERAWRWCQRRPAVASLIALVGLVTAVGFAGVTWQWRKAESLRMTAENNLAESERQRKRRDANFEKSLEAVDTMLTYVGEKSLANVPRMQGIRKRMLEDAATFYVGFVVESSDDPDILAESARANLRVGDIRDTLDESEQALSAYDKAVSVLDRLNSDYPDRISFQRDLGEALARRARFQFRQRRLENAEIDITRSIEIQKLLAAESPDDDSLQVSYAARLLTLATIHNQAGKKSLFDEETNLALETLADLDDSSDKSWYEANIRYLIAMHLQEHRVDNKGTEDQVTRAIKSLDDLVAEFPNDIEYQQKLIASKRILAAVLANAGRLDEAEQQMGALAAAWQHLADDYPHVPQYRQQVAKATADRAICNHRSGRMNRAEELWIEAIGIRRALVRDTPLPDYRRSLATNLLNLGVVILNSGRPEEAQAWFEQSLEVRQGLMSEFPDVEIYQHEVNIVATNLAYSIFVTEMEDNGEVVGEPLDRAEDLLDLAVEVGEPLIEREDANAIHLHKMAITHRTRGQLWANIDAEKSEAALLKSLAIMRGLAEQAPQDHRYPRQLHYSLDQLADFYVLLNSPEEAEKAARESNAVIEKLAVDSQVFAYRFDHAVNTRKLGDLLTHLNADAEALFEYRKAIDLFKQLQEKEPEHQPSRLQMPEAHRGLAYLMATSGDADVQNTNDAVTHAKTAVELDPENEDFHATLGIAYFCNGELESSVKELTATRDDENDPESSMYLAMGLWHMGDTERALEIYEASLKSVEVESIPQELKAEAARLFRPE